MAALNDLKGPEHGVQTVAERLGVWAVERRGVSPCPSCGADQRGSRDPRAPIGLTADGVGWRCHRCQAGGDALALAGWALAGDPAPRGAAFRAVLEAVGTVEQWPRVARPAIGRPVHRAPESRPPLHEVVALWRACGPVDDDPACAGWLRSRGLDPTTVRDLDLARALPECSVPRWARARGARWTESGHRLIVPLFDALGRLASMRARVVTAGQDRPKALAPASHTTAGLVMADALARRLLTGDADAVELVRDVGLLVAEGGPDHLTWATRWGADGALDRAPAVVGVESGAWTAEVAARVPDGVRVLVATHDDATGDLYAAAIVASFGPRPVEVWRWA